MSLNGFQEKVRPGEIVVGEGVYVGPTVLRAESGDSLGVFDFYSAPVDVRPGEILSKNFKAAARRVAELGENWCWHEVRPYGTQAKLAKAIDSGDYTNQWVFPTLQQALGVVLSGPNVLQTRRISEPNLFALKNTGFFRMEIGKFGNGNYWTCTPENRVEKACKPKVLVDFECGAIDYASRDVTGDSVRLVRFVPRKLGLG